ncbi:MAG: tetratricopeptide repeat protein [Planctomycetota bacterium]
MKRIIGWLTLVCIAVGFASVRGQGQDEEFVVEQYNQLIPVDPDQRIWEMTEVLTEDMYYITGRFRRQAVAIPTHKVVYVHRLLTLADDQQGLTANLPADASNLEGAVRAVKLSQLVSAGYWNQIVKRVSEGRFNNASKLILYTFKTDETINTVWPWARTEATFYLGEQYLSEANYAKAVECFKEILSNSPKSRFALPAALKIGQAYIGAGEYKNADDTFNNGESSMLVAYEAGIGSANANDRVEFRQTAELWRMRFRAYKALNLKAEVISGKGDPVNALRVLRNWLETYKDQKGAEDLVTLIKLAILDVMLVTKDTAKVREECEKEIKKWQETGDLELQKRIPFIYIRLADAMKQIAFENEGNLQGCIDLNLARWYYITVATGFPEYPELVEKSLFFSGLCFITFEDWKQEEDNEQWAFHWGRLVKEFPKSSYVADIERLYPDRYKIITEKSK